MYKFICANITKSRNFTNSYKKLAQNKKIHLDGSNSKAASDKDGLEEKWEEGQDPNEEEIGLNPSPARPSTSPAPAGRFSFAPTIRNIKSTTSSPSLKAKSHARFPTGNFYSAGSPSTSISKKYYHVYNITQVPTTLKRFSSSAAFGNFENCDETNENYKKAMEDLYKIQSKKPAFQWKVVNSGKPSYIPNEIWAKRDKKKSSLEITYPTHTVKHNLMLGQRFRIKEGSASKKMIKLEGNFKQKKHFIPKTLKKRIYSRKITYPTMPENSKTKRRINVVTMTQCHSNAGEIEESGVPLIKVVKSVREQGGMSLKYFSDAQSARSIPPKQPKPIDSIEKDFESLIRSHPTIQNASKEVKMKLKNRFIQLLLKSSPEPDAAAVSENKATAEEVPAEDNDKNIVEEDGKKLADNKEFKEEEGHVQEADKQVAMNDEQIKYHPSSVYTENPQQNDYSAIKYTKRVFTDSVNNFDINDVCIKDPNNKSGSVFVQPGIGIEEPKLNYKNLQKEAEKLSTFVSLQSLKKTCADSVKENKKKNKMASHNTETKLEQLKKERQKLLDELEKVSKIKNEEEAKIKNAKLKEEVKRKNHEARVENEMALDEVRANKDQTKAQRLTECMKNQIVNDDLAAAMAKNKDIKDEIAKVKKNFSSLKRDQRVQKTKQIQETATEVETINKMTGNAELEKTSQKVEDKVKPYIKTTEELDKSEEIRSISRSEGRKEPFRKVSLKEERERNNKYDIDRQDKEKSVRPRQLKLKRLPKLFATSDIPRESKKAKGPDNSKMSTTPSDFETTYQSLDEPDETVKHLNEIAQRTKAAAVKRKLKQEERRLYEEKIQKQNSLPSLKSNHSEPRLDKMADLLKEKVQIAEKSKEKIKQLSVEIPQKTNRPTARRGKRSSPGKLDSNVYQVNTFDEVTKYDKLNQMAHDLSLKIRKKKKEEDTSKPRGNKTGTLLNQGSSAENKQPDEPKNNQKKDDFEDPNKLPEQTLSPSEGQPLKRNKGLGHVKEEKEKAKSEKLKTQNVEKHRKIGGIKDHPAVYCIKPEVGKTTACGINDQLPCINKEPEIAFIKPVTPGKETGLSLTVKTSELANVDKDNNITIEDVRQARNLNQAVDSVKSLKVDLQPAQEALSETFVLDLYKDNVFKDYSVVNNYKEQVVSKYFDEKLPGNRQQLYFPKPSLVISDVPETQDSTGLIQDKNADIFENSRNRPREKIEIKTNGQHDTLTDNSDLLKPQASKNLNEFFPKSKKGGFMEIINNHLETKQNHLNVENDHVEVKANDSEMKDTNFNQQIKDKTAEMDADLCLSVDRALEEVIQLDEMLEKIKDFERMLVRQKRVKISGARLENKPRVPPMQKPPTDKKDKKEKPKGPNDMVLPPKARRANPPVPESVPKGHRPEEENVKPTKKATNTKKSPILTDNHFAKKGKFEAHQKVADQNAQEVILQPYNRNKPPPDTPNLEQAISDFIREEKLDEVYDKRDNVKPESSKNVPRETDSKTDKNNDEKFGTDANLASEVTVSDPNFKKKEAGNHFSEGFAMIEPITMVAPRARSLSPVKSNLGKETSLGYKEKFPVLIKPSDGALREQDPSSSKNALQIQKNISNRGGITMNNITMRGPVVKSVTVIRERFENGRAATFGPKEARIPASAKNNLRGKTVPSRPVSCPPLSAQIRKSKNIDTRAVLVENKAGGRAASCPPKSSSDGIQDSNANNSNWLMKSEQQRAVSVPSRAQSLKAVVKISKPNTAVVKKPLQKESIAVVASVSSRLFTCPPAVIQRRRTNKNEEKQIVNKSDYKNSIGPPTKPSARGRPSIVNFVKPRPISCPPTTALIKKLGKPGRHVRGTDDNSAFRTASCPPKSSTSGLQEQTKYFNLSSQPASQQSMRTSKSAQKLQESKTKFSSWSSNSIPPKNPDTPLAEVKTGSTEKKDSVKRETTRSSSLPAPSKNPDFSTAGTPAGSGAPKGKKVYMSRLSKEELGKKEYPKELPKVLCDADKNLKQDKPLGVLNIVIPKPVMERRKIIAATRPADQSKSPKIIRVTGYSSETVITYGSNGTIGLKVDQENIKKSLSIAGISTSPELRLGDHYFRNHSKIGERVMDKTSNISKQQDKKAVFRITYDGEVFIIKKADETSDESKKKGSVAATISRTKQLDYLDVNRKYLEARKSLHDSLVGDVTNAIPIIKLNKEKVEPFGRNVLNVAPRKTPKIVKPVLQAIVDTIPNNITKKEKMVPFGYDVVNPAPKIETNEGNPKSFRSSLANVTPKVTYKKKKDELFGQNVDNAIPKNKTKKEKIEPFGQDEVSPVPQISMNEEKSKPSGHDLANATSKVTTKRENIELLGENVDNVISKNASKFRMKEEKAKSFGYDLGNVAPKVATKKEKMESPPKIKPNKENSKLSGHDLANDNPKITTKKETMEPFGDVVTPAPKIKTNKENSKLSGYDLANDNPKITTKKETMEPFGDVVTPAPKIYTNKENSKLAGHDLANDNPKITTKKETMKPFGDVVTPAPKIKTNKENSKRSGHDLANDNSKITTKKETMEPFGDVVNPSKMTTSEKNSKRSRHDLANANPKITTKKEKMEPFGDVVNPAPNIRTSEENSKPFGHDSVNTNSYITTKKEKAQPFGQDDVVNAVSDVNTKEEKPESIMRVYRKQDDKKLVAEIKEIILKPPEKSEKAPAPVAKIVTIYDKKSSTNLKDNLKYEKFNRGLTKVVPTEQTQKFDSIFGGLGSDAFQGIKNDFFRNGLRNAKSNLDSKDNVLKKSQSETGLKSEPSVDTITNKLSKKTTDVFKTVINSSKGNRQEDIQKKSQSKDEVVMKHDFLKPNSSDAKNINTKMKSMPKVLTKKAESTDNNLELKWTFPESTKTESLIGDMKPTVHSNGSKKNLPQTGKIEITKVEGNVYININSKLPGNENITDKITTKPNTGTTVKKQLDENIEKPKAKSNILFKKKQEHPTSSAQSLENTKLYNIYINDEMTRSTPQIVKKSNLKIPDEKRKETEGKEDIIESEKLDVSKNTTKYGEAPSELHLRTNLFNICINKTSNENISVPKKEKPELPLNNLNTIVGNNLETKARQDRIDQSSDPVKFSYPSVYKREKKELLPQNTSKEYVQINNIYVKKSFRSILESGYHISNPPFSNIFETTTIKLLDNKNKLKKSNSSSKTTLQDALKKNQDTDNLDMDYLPLKKVVLSVNVDTVNVEEIYQTKQLKNRIKDDLENADITKFPPHTSFVEFTEDEALSKKKNSSGDVAKGKKKGTNQPSKNPDSTKPGKNLHEKELTDILKPGILTVFTKEKLESSPSKELADFTKVGNMFIRNSDHKLEQSLQRNDMYTLNIPKLEDGVAKKKSNAAEKVLSDINYSNNSFKSSSMYILNIPSVLDKTNIPQVSPKQEVKPTKSDNLANKTFDDFFTSNAKKNVNGNSKKSLHLKDVPKNELKDSIYSYRKSFGQNKPLEVKKTISTDLNSPNLTDGQKNDLKSAKSDKLPTTPFIVNKRVLDTKKPGETELEMNAKNIEKETPPTNSTKFSDIGKERANVANTDTKDKQESENDKLRYKCVEVSSRFELDEVFGERQNLFKTLKSKSIKDISNKSDSMQEQDIMDQQKIDLELKSKTTNQNTPQIDESKPRGKLLFRSKSVQEKLREENDGVSSDLKGSTTYFEPSETSGQPKDQGNKLIEDKQDLKLNSEATNPNTKNVFESVATKVENDDWLKRKLLMNKNKDERQKSPNSESMPKIVSNLKDINETIRKIIISKIEDVTKEITKKTVEDEELGKNKQLKPSKTNDPMSKKIGEAKYDTKLMETTSKKDDQKETLDNLKKPIRSETVKENIKNAADKLVKCGIMDEKCLSTQKIVMNPKSDSKLNNVVLEESNVKDQLLEPIETKPQTDSQDVYETEPDAGKHVKAISKPYLSFLGKLDQEDQIKRREKFKKRMNSCKRVGQVIKRKEREKINEIQEMNSAAQHILKRKEEQEWDEMFRGGKRQRLYEKETKMSRPSSGTAPWGVKVKDSELLEPPGKKDDTKNVHNSTNVPPSGENPSKKGGPKLMSRAEFYKLQRKINPSKTKNSDKEKMAVKLATNKQESKKDIQESFDKNQLSETKLLDNAQELKNLKQSASDSDFSITKKTSLTSEIMTFKINKMAKLLVDDLTNNKSKEKFIKGNLEELSEVENYPFIKSKKVAKGSLNNKKKDDKNLPPSGLSQNTGSQKNAGKSSKTTKDTTEMKKTNGNSNVQIRKGDDAPLQEKGKTNLGPAKQEKSNKKLNETNMKSQSLQEAVDLNNKRSEDISKYFNIFQGVIQQPDIPSKKEDKTPIKSDVQKITMNLKSGETKSQTDSQDVDKNRAYAGNQVIKMVKPSLTLLSKLEQEDQQRRREAFEKTRSSKKIGQEVKPKGKEKIEEVPMKSNKKLHETVTKSQSPQEGIDLNNKGSGEILKYPHFQGPIQQTDSPSKKEEDKASFKSDFQKIDVNLKREGKSTMIPVSDKPHPKNDVMRSEIDKMIEQKFENRGSGRFKLKTRFVKSMIYQDGIDSANKLANDPFDKKKTSYTTLSSANKNKTLNLVGKSVNYPQQCLKTDVARVITDAITRNLGSNVFLDDPVSELTTDDAKPTSEVNDKLETCFGSNITKLSISNTEGAAHNNKFTQSKPVSALKSYEEIPAYKTKESISKLGIHQSVDNTDFNLKTDTSKLPSSISDTNPPNWNVNKFQARSTPLREFGTDHTYSDINTFVTQLVLGITQATAPNSSNKLSQNELISERQSGSMKSSSVTQMKSTTASDWVTTFENLKGFQFDMSKTIDSDLFINQLE